MSNFDSGEVQTLARYCAEETRRQYAYDFAEPHAIQVGGLISAFVDAIAAREGGTGLDADMIEAWGGMIEPVKNRSGFRQIPIFVGGQEKSPWQVVPRLMEIFVDNIGDMEPLEAYRAFEDIHPFQDGNGRTGKIILNWVNDSLRDPIFPPNDFWGVTLGNP